MRRIQSPKLLGLVGLGFVVVALPLVAAMVTAIGQVDRLADESRSALVSVQQNASISRNLADRVRELERSARQYKALEDSEYRDLYTQHRTAVLELLDRLTSLNDRGEMNDLLARARESEERADRTFALTVRGDETQNLEAAFGRLNDDILVIVRRLDSEAQALSQALPERASHLQELLVAQAALVIPLSAGLGLLFGAFVSRSFGQIDRSIRKLGQGELQEPISVKGPQDLEELGQRLEWLRVRLQELETQKAEFLRNVSHELKTPLTNVREAAELLFEDVEVTDTRAERDAILAILRENSRRLQKMIEELLRYGAAGAARPDTREVVELDALVSNAIDAIRMLPATRAVSVRSSLDPVSVEGNESRLRLVVDNLLSNAVKYSPHGGAVDVELRTDAGAAILDVKDEGPGVQAQDVPRIFEWFFTGEQPEKSVIAGTGMGLAIAQEYARQEGGRILLLPSAGGAHFRLILEDKVNDAS